MTREAHMSEERRRTTHEDFADRMMAEARELRAAAEAAWLPAVKGQLMNRVMELENAAAVDRPSVPTGKGPR